MKTAYGEAQDLNYTLQEAIDAERNNINNMPTIGDKIFDAAYRYGMITAFNKAKEIIDKETSLEMCDLINDKRNFEAMLNELEELRKYKEEHQ